MVRLLIVTLLAAVLAACAGAADRSPRTQALDLMAKYNALQTVALAAVTSPLLADRPTVKRGIKASTKVATAAVLSFDDVTRGCRRDPDSGMITIAEGERCEPSNARRLYPVALRAFEELQGVLIEESFLNQSLLGDSQ